MMDQHGTGGSSRIRNSWAQFAARASRWLLVLGVILASQATGARAAASHGPQRGGTIIWAERNGSFDSFIPIISPAEIVDDEAQVLLFRPLLWIGQKVAIQWDRSIAKSIAVSANQTAYTVQLRNDYKWSDGTPVTAADVQYCFNLMKAYGTKYAYYGTGGLPNQVKSFTVNGPYSFTITMSTPFNPTY
ncbi:MAG: ABC transporter substrate-binding protein, partial [Chloroflexota bacterium]